MNLKTTPLLFGLLLVILWSFGLTLAYKKTAVDEALVLPSLRGGDVKIDTVHIKYEGDKDKKPDVLLIQEGESWYHKEGGQKVKVEGFRVEQLIRQVKDAKKNEEFRASEDLGNFGLAQPRLVVTLKGKAKERDKEARFF